MQKTRLTILSDIIVQQISLALRNPWRRISLILVSLLFGNFAATVVATVTGQAASWDVIVAIILTFSCELISWLVYRRREQLLEKSWTSRLSKSASPEMSSTLSTQSRFSAIQYVANAIKIGLIYGLFVEALKLGS